MTPLAVDREPRAMLLGVAIDALTLPQTVERIDRAIREGRRGYVVTPNVDHIIRLQRDPALRAAYAAAAWRVVDGVPLLWAARLLGRRLPGRVAGTDLVPALCALAASRGYRIFVLGGRSGAAARAAARLRARFPGLQVAGTHTPPDAFGADRMAWAEALSAVNAARPDLLFVGLGAPLQEVWVHAHWDHLDATAAICCGGAVDYAAGLRTRAPWWMQRAGLEWLWRLLAEPRRLWRRYLVDDAAFLGIVVREWWRLRVKASR